MKKYLQPQVEIREVSTPVVMAAISMTTAPGDTETPVDAKQNVDWNMWEEE